MSGYSAGSIYASSRKATDKFEVLVNLFEGNFLLPTVTLTSKLCEPRSATLLLNKYILPYFPAPSS